MLSKKLDHGLNTKQHHKWSTTGDEKRFSKEHNVSLKGQNIPRGVNKQCKCKSVSGEASAPAYD